MFRSPIVISQIPVILIKKWFKQTIQHTARPSNRIARPRAKMGLLKHGSRSFAIAFGRPWFLLPQQPISTELWMGFRIADDFIDFITISSTRSLTKSRFIAMMMDQKDEKRKNEISTRRLDYIKNHLGEEKKNLKIISKKYCVCEGKNCWRWKDTRNQII